MECSKCGRSGELFDGISSEGVVRVCRDCVEKFGMPVVQKPREKTFQDVNSVNSVRNRLAQISGAGRKPSYQQVLNEQDKMLKAIAEKNSDRDFQEIDDDVLVDNFHWIVMRARRMKKLTQEQFAREIGETETAIAHLEKKQLSANYRVLVKKVENALGIKLFRTKENSGISPWEEEKKVIKENLMAGNEEVSFDDVATRTLTIGDLKEMKQEKEETIFGGDSEEKVFREKIEFDDKKNEEKKDLSQEEIDRIIFGR